MGKYTFEIQSGTFRDSEGGIPIINASIRIGDIYIRIFAGGTTYPKTSPRARNRLTFFFMKGFPISYFHFERYFLAA
jgi:hypothetical protein